MMTLQKLKVFIITTIALQNKFLSYFEIQLLLNTVNLNMLCSIHLHPKYVLITVHLPSCFGSKIRLRKEDKFKNILNNVKLNYT